MVDAAAPESIGKGFRIPLTVATPPTQCFSEVLVRSLSSESCLEFFVFAQQSVRTQFLLLVDVILWVWVHEMAPLGLILGSRFPIWIHLTLDTHNIVFGEERDVVEEVVVKEVDERGRRRKEGTRVEKNICPSFHGQG